MHKCTTAPFTGGGENVKVRLPSKLVSGSLIKVLYCFVKTRAAAFCLLITLVGIAVKASPPLADSLSSLKLKDSKGLYHDLVGIKDNTGTVVVFLSPECPISQQYTLDLNRMGERFREDHMTFYGVIPGRLYSGMNIDSFQNTYKISFPLLIDADYKLTRLLQASITPEAFLLNDKSDIVYSGAIDDAWLSLGKKRSNKTRTYLTDAIDAMIGKRGIQIKKTKAVGCLIEGLKRRQNE